MDLPDLSLEELLKTCNLNLSSSMGQLFENLYNKGIRCKYNGKFLIIPRSPHFVLLSFADQDKKLINITSDDGTFKDQMNVDSTTMEASEIHEFIAHKIQPIIKSTGKLTELSRLNNEFELSRSATPMTWAKMESVLDKFLADQQMS